MGASLQAIEIPMLFPKVNFDRSDRAGTSSKSLITGLHLLTLAPVRRSSQDAPNAG